MLKNAYFLAKIGADTAENERKFAEFCRNRQLPYWSTEAHEGAQYIGGGITPAHPKVRINMNKHRPGVTATNPNVGPTNPRAPFSRGPTNPRSPCAAMDKLIGDSQISQPNPRSPFASGEFQPPLGKSLKERKQIVLEELTA